MKWKAHITFSSMKELSSRMTDEERQRALTYRKEKGAGHIRKGIVGDSKNVVTEEQRARFVAKCEKEFEGTDYPWGEYLQ